MRGGMRLKMVICFLLMGVKIELGPCAPWPVLLGRSVWTLSIGKAGDES